MKFSLGFDHAAIRAVHWPLKTTWANGCNYRGEAVLWPGFMNAPVHGANRTANYWGRHVLRRTMLGGALTMSRLVLRARADPTDFALRLGYVYRGPAEAQRTAGALRAEAAWRRTELL